MSISEISESGDGGDASHRRLQHSKTSGFSASNVGSDAVSGFDGKGKDFLFDPFAAPKSGGHRTLNNTPFKDIRVRQAVAHAIDSQTIVDALLKRSSQVIKSSCFPSQFGCDTDVTTYDYDPEKSKALLAEAGYPEGFTTDFYACRDRKYTEAISSFLNGAQPDC